MEHESEQARSFTEPSSLEPYEDEYAAPAQLLGELDRHTSAACTCCDRRLCGHEVLFSVASGIKDSPRCLECLAEGLQRSVGELREQIASYIQSRDCYRKAWDIACDRENQPRSARPDCLWSDKRCSNGTPAPPIAEANPALTHEQEPEASWDAGDMGCGELVLALRIRLNALPGGAVLKVTARDPAAPEDLPAWCRLTGHRLLRSEHPDYYIQRKEP